MVPETSKLFCTKGKNRIEVHSVLFLFYNKKPIISQEVLKISCDKVD